MRPFLKRLITYSYSHVKWCHVLSGLRCAQHPYVAASLSSIKTISREKKFKFDKIQSETAVQYLCRWFKHSLNSFGGYDIQV
jgi:hypothetical protein